VAGSCKHDNEPVGFMKDGDIFKDFEGYLLFRNFPAPSI
jgi:hypothetical protein